MEISERKWVNNRENQLSQKLVLIKNNRRHIKKKRRRGRRMEDTNYQYQECMKGHYYRSYGHHRIISNSMNNFVFENLHEMDEWRT